MSLGLSHSLSRYKLKFSPDKVSPDTAPGCLLWYSLCAARHGNFMLCLQSGLLLCRLTQ